MHNLRPDQLAGRYERIAAQLEELFARTADPIARMATAVADRDADGEYFQIYTGNIAGWLFFEVVQRRDYSGFGASNAPIRLAAS